MEVLAINLKTKIFFLIALSCFVISNSMGQKIVELTNANDGKLIGEYIYIYKEINQTFDFKSISKPENDKLFELYNRKTPNFGNVRFATWNKIFFVNHSNKKWVLVVSNLGLDSVIFFCKQPNGQLTKILSGRSQPIANRNFKTSYLLFDLNLKENDSVTCYLKVKSYILDYPIKIMTQKKLIETCKRTNRWEGAYVGFLVLLALYNIFLYVTSKDKNYLYYLIYILFNGLLIAQISGNIIELFGTCFHFLWPYGPAIVAVCAFVTFIFTIHILAADSNAPSLKKLLYYVFLPVYILVIFLSIFGNNVLASKINQVTSIIALLIMYIAAIIIYRKGYKYARFYIAACWSYFLGVIIYALKVLSVLPHNVLTENSIAIGSTIQMIMFAFTLADKMNTYKLEEAIAEEKLLKTIKANEKFVLEQNKILESQVIEKTKELRNTLFDLKNSQIELMGKNKLILKEKESRESLLRNILPDETANELIKTGSCEPKHFENVSVLFSDFVGFTLLSEKQTPTEVVEELNLYFSAFDQIVESNGVEKIKTIGDAYMAAAGLPTINKYHAIQILKTAFEIIEFVEIQKLIRKKKGLSYLEVRIGINTGPVVAGIVGQTKFAYDIWGDTVNTASRMETNSIPGKINISETTYQLVKDQVSCTYRGKVKAKHKGLVDMYFVDFFK